MKCQNCNREIEGVPWTVEEPGGPLRVLCDACAKDVPDIYKTYAGNGGDVRTVEHASQEENGGE